MPLPPIGLQKMENSTFLALLRLLSALESKKAPPPLAFGMQNIFFLIGVQENLDTKAAPISGEDLFFWSSL